MILVLAAVPSFATSPAPATAGGTIVIENATVGETYQLHRIFDATYNTVTGTTAYTTDAAHKALFAGDSPFVISDTPDSNGRYAVSPKTGKTTDDIIAWLEPIIFRFSPPAGQVDATSNTVTFTNLPYGYYFIRSGLGSVVTLDTNTPNVTVRDKNISAPTRPVKRVSVDTAQIGDTVSFEVEFISSNYYKTVAGDTVGELIRWFNFEDAPDGFDIILSTLKVEVKQPGDAQFVDKTSEIYDDSVTNGVLRFKLPWADSNGSLYGASTRVLVSYDGIVNAAAGDGDATNTVTVSHNQNVNPQTASRTVRTYSATVTKTDGTTTLSGAEFELYDAAPASASPLTLVDITESGATTRKYRPAVSGDTVTTTKIAAGVAQIVGLDGETTYYFVETKAPDGYNLLTDPEEVVFKYLPYEGAPRHSYRNVSKEIVNSAGVELPETGGTGTTLFIVFGTLIAVAAAVIIVTNRRAKNANV